MLKAYRRHRLPKCSQTNREYRRCACVIWVDGTLEGKRYHKTLDTRNWDLAQKKVLELESRGSAPDAEKTIADACDAFIRDCNARGLRNASIYKYQLLFKQLKAFSENRGIENITECDVETLRLFRESWINKNYSARKKLEALRTFFRFVRDSGWLETNPAVAIKSPKVVEGTTMPFTKSEVERVLKACDIYPREEHPNKIWGKRLRALTLLLRYSGLRIADAVTLSKHSITDGRLILRTAKTGVPVRVLLPQVCLAALEDVGSGEYYFWSGLGTKKSCVGDYQRAFKKLYELAEVEGGHAHRWRDTFAVELLLARVPIADVATLLGHSSTKVTERHYSPWVVARQEQLDATVAGTFPANEPHPSATTSS
jgi:integrase/recombinase XerD